MRKNWEVKGIYLGNENADNFRALTIEPNICSMDSSLSPQDVADNARLIAASPDLLAALIEIVAAADGGGWLELDAGLNNARAAIAKAIGGAI